MNSCTRLLTTVSEIFFEKKHSIVTQKIISTAVSQSTRHYNLPSLSCSHMMGRRKQYRPSLPPKANNKIASAQPQQRYVTDASQSAETMAADEGKVYDDDPAVATETCCLNQSSDLPVIEPCGGTSLKSPSLQPDCPSPNRSLSVSIQACSHRRSLSPASSDARTVGHSSLELECVSIDGATPRDNAIEADTATPMQSPPSSPAPNSDSVTVGKRCTDDGGSSVPSSEIKEIQSVSLTAASRRIFSMYQRQRRRQQTNRGRSESIYADIPTYQDTMHQQQRHEHSAGQAHNQPAPPEPSYYQRYGEYFYPYSTEINDTHVVTSSSSSMLSNGSYPSSGPSGVENTTTRTGVRNPLIQYMHVGPWVTNACDRFYHRRPIPQVDFTAPTAQHQSPLSCSKEGMLWSREGTPLGRARTPAHPPVSNSPGCATPCAGANEGFGTPFCQLHTTPHKFQTVSWLHNAQPRDRFVFLIDNVRGCMSRQCAESTIRRDVTAENSSVVPTPTIRWGCQHREYGVRDRVNRMIYGKNIPGFAVHGRQSLENYVASFFRTSSASSSLSSRFCRGVRRCAVASVGLVRSSKRGRQQHSRRRGLSTPHNRSTRAATSSRARASENKRTCTPTTEAQHPSPVVCGVEIVEISFSDVTALDYRPGLLTTQLAIETKRAVSTWFPNEESARYLYNAPKFDRRSR